MLLIYRSHHLLSAVAPQLKLFSAALLIMLLSSCDQNSGKQQVSAAIGDTTKEVEFEQGVSWQLAEHRSETLSGLKYSYSLTIPENISDPITGKAVASFNWNDESAQPVVMDFLSPSERVKALSVNGIETSWQASHDHMVIPASAFVRGRIPSNLSLMQATRLSIAITIFCTRYSFLIALTSHFRYLTNPT